jgi:hypothetical protein
MDTPNEVLKFLNALWPQMPAGLHLPIFSLPGERTQWCESTEQAAQAAISESETRNVYLGVSLQDRAAAFAAGGQFSRGTAKTAAALAGLWLDVDIRGPGHTAQNLPADEAEAMSLLGKMQLHPSVLVRSGGGLQAWWLFSEPWVFDDDADRNRAAVLAASWVMTAQAHGNAAGWKVDSTKDLARVLRVVGTCNRKQSPVLITAEYFPERYQPSDFDEFIYPELMEKSLVGDAPGAMADDGELYSAVSCVDCLSAVRSDNRDEWISVGMALKSLNRESEAFAAFDRFSRLSCKYDAKDCRETWDSFKPNGSIGVGSLIYRARRDIGTIPVDKLPAKTAWQICAPQGQFQAQTNSKIVVETTMLIVAGGPRQRLANVVDGKIHLADGEERSVTHYLPTDLVSQRLSEATGNWPRRAGGVLFAVAENRDLNKLPDHRDVTWLTNTDKLFAWIQRAVNLRWTTKTATDPITSQPLTPASKKEFFEYLIHYAKPSYDGLEVLPHEPPIEGIYYIPCTLVPARQEGGPLDQLVERFNPETPLDQALLLAALMTPGWGGPPGARPVFLFTSDHGRGVGKSCTASAFADIWGGAIGIGANEDWDQIRKRLLGDDALSKRCTFMDNIKQRLTGGDIEGMITSNAIDGWKPYHGQASRPNYLTWYMTANTPSLSRDLADRAVVIKMGKQKPGEDFLGWTRDHIARHRIEIVSALMDILKSPPACVIEHRNRDRWGAWQLGVLSRFPNGNELAAMIIARRAGVDSDTDDAEDVAGAVVELVEKTYPDHEERRVFITRQQLYQWLTKKGLVGKDIGVRGCTTWVRGMANSGPLHFFSEHKTSAERGWKCVGRRAMSATSLDIIPDDPGEYHGWTK